MQSNINLYIPKIIVLLKPVKRNLKAILPISFKISTNYHYHFLTGQKKVIRTSNGSYKSILLRLPSASRDEYLLLFYIILSKEHCISRYPKIYHATGRSMFAKYIAPCSGNYLPTLPWICCATVAPILGSLLLSTTCKISLGSSTTFDKSLELCSFPTVITYVCAPRIRSGSTAFCDFLIPRTFVCLPAASSITILEPFRPVRLNTCAAYFKGTSTLRGVPTAGD